MQDPFVSVVVPVYNRADLISSCLESVFAQSYTNIEVVIVDNFSDDGTWDVLEAVKGRDLCFEVRTYRNEANLGPHAHHTGGGGATDRKESRSESRSTDYGWS